MSLLTKDNEELNDYYQRQQRQQTYEGNCDESNKTHWWGFTPYDFQETIYYSYRMLVLPGAITTIVIFLIIIGVYENVIIGVISTFLTYIASLLISIYIREKRRERRCAIPDSEKLTTSPLNEIKETKFRIGFVGDIMRMRDYELKFSADVHNFFNDVNIIIGNLEGIVKDDECPLTKQSHPKKILQQLQDLLGDNTKWLLCLGNNHSIDFGNQEFHKSLHIVRQESNIDVFGRNDVPYVFVEGQNINIATATEWSNQKNWNCIAKFGITEVELYHSSNKFNILYPHWSYENERYVRSSIQNKAKQLLTSIPNKKWDLIFGHHPHVRQPIMKFKDEYKDQQGNSIEFWKLVAFSGGNFTSGVTFLRKKKHIHGTIMKCDIGPLEDNDTQLAVGKVVWQNTVNEKKKINGKATKVIEFDYEEERISRICLLIIGIVSIVLFIMLKLLDFFL
ncbi:MAG: CapA family protein [Candidatus Thorarchaeota archaeon]